MFFCLPPLVQEPEGGRMKRERKRESDGERGSKRERKTARGRVMGREEARGTGREREGEWWREREQEGEDKRGRVMGREGARGRGRHRERGRVMGREEARGRGRQRVDQTDRQTETFFSKVAKVGIPITIPPRAPIRWRFLAWYIEGQKRQHDQYIFNTFPQKNTHVQVKLHWQHKALQNLPTLKTFFFFQNSKKSKSV